MLYCIWYSILLSNAIPNSVHYFTVVTVSIISAPVWRMQYTGYYVLAPVWGRQYTWYYVLAPVWGRQYTGYYVLVTDDAFTGTSSFSC